MDGLYAIPIYESALPALAAPDGTRGIVAVVSDDGNTRISRADGAPGSWVPAGNVLGAMLWTSFGEVPPSAALPTGRLLAGVWNGVSSSVDGGQSYQPTNLYQFGGYIAYSFAFVPVEGHPYGGVAFVGVDNTALGFAPRTEVHRSDDGGATWTLAHRFTPEETGLPAITGDLGTGYPFDRLVLAASPGGTLFAAVHYNQGPQPPGVILRSSDLGATWSRADAGFTGHPGLGYFPPSTPEQPFGWRVHRFALSRTGVLYAATDRGVWRTTQPVVAGEAGPEAPGGVSLSVRPNPSDGAVTLALTSSRAERVRVEVVDASGRVVFEAAEVHATPGGVEVRLPSERWAAGVYVARATRRTASAREGQHTEHVTARFTVTR